MSSYPPELWTWQNYGERIRSLTGRLGVPQGGNIEILGYELDLANGSIRDTLMCETLDLSERKPGLIANTIFYVLSAYSDSPEKEPTGKLITSKQFRGAQFTRRDTLGERHRIIRSFKNPESLDKAVRALGGSRIEFPYGDTAVSLNVLPLVPLTIVLSVEDGEFPADVRIFYDETVENYFDSEQTYFLTNLAVSRLIQTP